MLVIMEEGSDGKGCRERVEAHVGGEKGMVEGNKDSWRQACGLCGMVMVLGGGLCLLWMMIWVQQRRTVRSGAVGRFVE